MKWKAQKFGEFVALFRNDEPEPVCVHRQISVLVDLISGDVVSHGSIIKVEHTMEMIEVALIDKEPDETHTQSAPENPGGPFMVWVTNEPEEVERCLNIPGYARAKCTYALLQAKAETPAVIAKMVRGTS